MDTVTAATKSRRGFASMTPERQREIARKGGRSVPSDQRSFAKSPELASSAGRKGGLAVNAAKRSFSVDRQLASQAGKKGGHASRNTRPEDDVISGGA
ncbi:general stress protein [Methylocystis rosea]|uniref:Stress-induced protein n=1 Tax=Methylocystis rosea TaxID=173366 RepID=A0A3G8MAK2_9HYPH|nr:general stress protein [Methylocystis rosea]AZG78335.1 stress-induced protein [Methylocystis rosea]